MRKVEPFTVTHRPRFGLSDQTVLNTATAAGLGTTATIVLGGSHVLFDGYKSRTALDSMIGLALFGALLWLGAKACIPTAAFVLGLLSKEVN